MTEYELKLVRKEGLEAFHDSVSILDCPYNGVSEVLLEEWEEGWWDGFYENE